jgi:hypothetical protein
MLLLFWLVLCNNAKSDEFTYEEFKRVGDVIKEIWQQRKSKPSPEKLRHSVKKGWRWPPYL